MYGGIECKVQLICITRSQSDNINITDIKYPITVMNTFTVKKLTIVRTDRLVPVLFENIKNDQFIQHILKSDKYKEFFKTVT